MSTSFGATSTTDDVLAGIDLAGKRVLITGTSAGLGVETARVLRSRGATVIGTARDIAKGKNATNSSIEILPLDLSDLSSVRSVAKDLLERGEPFDLIIANAGMMATPFGKTKDGFETQFGTNHLGHFVLINRLLPLLKPGSRVVMLSSAGHRFGDVNIEDPNFETSDYSPFGAYGRSKTANILFAVEFDRRHKANGIRATAVHPGVIHTELIRHMDQAAFLSQIDQMNRAAKAKNQPEITMKTPAQGAATTVWAGVKADVDTVGGLYCEDCHIAEPAPNDPSIRNGVRAYALDPERARALWSLSEKMVGETY